MHPERNQTDQLRALRPTCPFLSSLDFKTVVSISIYPRLGYGNALYLGLLREHIGPLKVIQNSVARLISGFHCGTPSSIVSIGTSSGETQAQDASHDIQRHSWPGLPLPARQNLSSSTIQEAPIVWNRSAGYTQHQKLHICRLRIVPGRAHQCNLLSPSI